MGEVKSRKTRYHKVAAVFYLVRYFQFLIFPSDIQVIASVRRLSLVASVFASVTQVTYSFLLV